MAYSYVKYTGALMTAAYGGVADVLGIQEIVIEQKAKPVPKKIDTTTAPATSYEWTTDPLGGDGAPACTVTIKMLLSQTDYSDTPAGILAEAIGVAGALAVVPTVAGEHFDLADAYLSKRTVSPKVREFVPVTVVLDSAISAGAWTAT